MIEVNNFDALRPLLRFNDETKDIILVWVVKRNKDGNTDVKGNNKNRTIKSYHLQSMQQLDDRREEIMALCKRFNCRAYICVNPKPLINVLFTLQNVVNENLRTVVNHGHCMLLKGMLDSAVMKSGGTGDKMWVIDVDSKDEEDIASAIEIVNDARSQWEKNVIDVIPTAHGYHIISHPFDMRRIQGTGIEVKKDGLTLLYAYLNE